MALKSRIPNPRYNALRYGAALSILPLFLAACGGANTAASSTSSPSTASASATASTTPPISCSSYSAEAVASAEAAKPVPRTDEQYPAYIEYRHILADGGHIIEPSEIDSKCHAALKAGRSTLPNTFKTSMPTTLSPASDYRPLPPAVSTETSRTATNSSPTAQT